MNVDLAEVEVHPLRHCNPAHRHVVGVFAGEIKDLASFNLPIGHAPAEADQCRKHQHDCGLAVAALRREAVKKAPPQKTKNQIIRRHEIDGEVGARLDEVCFFGRAEAGGANHHAPLTCRKENLDIVSAPICRPS